MRHFPGPGTEAPGTFAISLAAASPGPVTAEWEAYTDRGFLRASLPAVELVSNPGGATTPIMLGAHSRTIVIRIPAGTHVYESWLRSVGTDVCAPPQGDPIHRRAFSTLVRETIPKPDPADAAIDAIVAPNLERMDCASPFVDARLLATVPPDYPRSASGAGTTLVKVTIGPDGTMVKASVFRSSGTMKFDEAVLESAAHSRYSAPVAFCRPTFGSYIVRTTFP